MSSEVLQCPVCLENYDLVGRLPRVSRCGHTLCNKCLLNILKSNDPKCPLDERSLQDGLPAKIDSFPVNFSLKDLVEQNSEWEFCSSHNGNKKEVVCMTDKCKLCLQCAFFAGHRDHEVKQMIDLKMQVASKAKDLEIAFENCNNYKRELDQKLEKNKSALLKAIEEHFDELAFLVKAKKIELILDLNDFFNQEKLNIEEAFGKNSSLRTSLESKIIKYQAFTMRQDIFDFLEEDVSAYTSKLQKDLLQNRLGQLEEDLETISTKFEHNLLDKVDFFKKLRIPSLDLGEKLKSAYIENNREEIASGFIKNPIFYQTKTSFELDVSDDAMTVTAINRAPKSVKIFPEKLKSVREILFTLASPSLTNKDIHVLVYIMNNLTQIDSIKVIAHNQPEINQDSLVTLLDVIFRRPQTLIELDINFVCSKIGDTSLILLAERILPKIESLKAFRLNAYNTQISDSAVNAFTRNALPYIKNVERFEVNFGETAVTENSLKAMFIGMPNIKVLEIGLSRTRISDSTIKVFAENTLAPIKRLEKLKLHLCNTDITDVGVERLFANIKDVKELQLDLACTPVTDKSIQKILDGAVPNLKSLKNFSIDVINTWVSNEIIEYINQVKRNLSAQETPQ